nr:hypothetical protein CFP56_70972 [Quercus suber]
MSAMEADDGTAFTAPDSWKQLRQHGKSVYIRYIDPDTSIFPFHHRIHHPRSIPSLHKSNSSKRHNAVANSTQHPPLHHRRPRHLLPDFLPTTAIPPRTRDPTSSRHRLVARRARAKRRRNLGIVTRATPRRLPKRFRFFGVGTQGRRIFVMSYEAGEKKMRYDDCPKGLGF